MAPVRLLPPPDPVTYSAETHVLAHELHYAPDVDLPRLLAILRELRATGSVSIHLNQGGVRMVSFRHERRIDL